MSHHASYSHHLLWLWGRLLTIWGRWRHLSWGRTEEYSDWREKDCTWSKDLRGRVTLHVRWVWKWCLMDTKTIRFNWTPQGCGGEGNLAPSPQARWPAAGHQKRPRVSPSDQPLTRAWVPWVLGWEAGTPWKSHSYECLGNTFLKHTHWREVFATADKAKSKRHYDLKFC